MVQHTVKICSCSRRVTMCNCRQPGNGRQEASFTYVTTAVPRAVKAVVDFYSGGQVKIMRGNVHDKYSDHLETLAASDPTKRF